MATLAQASAGQRRLGRGVVLRGGRNQGSGGGGQAGGRWPYRAVAVEMEAVSGGVRGVASVEAMSGRTQGATVAPRTLGSQQGTGGCAW